MQQPTLVVMAAGMGSRFGGLKQLTPVDPQGHPIIESEGLYEGALSGELSSRPITPAMMRRLAYLIMQSGGCGYTYGALGVWEWQKEAGTGGIGWGNLSWKEGLQLPGADQLTVWKKFYEEAGWSELKPIGEDKAVTKALFRELLNRNKIYFTANADMTKIVGYLSETSMRCFTLKGLASAWYEGYFMNPEDGSVTESFSFFPANGEWSYETEDLFGNKRDLVVFIVQKPGRKRRTEISPRPMKVGG